MAKRRNNVIFGALILIGIGALYALFVRLTGIGIPCLFHEITGLDCPGCGASRMALALFSLDPAAAFRFNPVLFCLLPLLFFCAFRYARAYIRRGAARDRLGEILIWIMIPVLLLWGVIRNLV